MLLKGVKCVDLRVGRIEVRAPYPVVVPAHPMILDGRALDIKGRIFFVERKQRAEVRSLLRVLLCLQVTGQNWLRALEQVQSRHVYELPAQLRVGWLHRALAHTERIKEGRGIFLFLGTLLPLHKSAHRVRRADPFVKLFSGLWRVSVLVVHLWLQIWIGAISLALNFGSGKYFLRLDIMDVKLNGLFFDLSRLLGRGARFPRSSLSQ